MPKTLLYICKILPIIDLFLCRVIQILYCLQRIWWNQFICILWVFYTLQGLLFTNYFLITVSRMPLYHEYLKNCILLTSEIAEKISIAITSKRFQLDISRFLILIKELKLTKFFLIEQIFCFIRNTFISLFLTIKHVQNLVHVAVAMNKS